MAQEILKPLGGHAVFLLLVQLALLLIVARLGAELCKRLGLPAVVGELAAGIALGPSLLGHFAPEVSAYLFPPVAEQFHLLEVVGTLGMVLLLLLTGLETDLRLLRNLGRAALIASIMGMVLPFATGFGLGLLTPDSYLADPERRVLFSFFLATAMAISAMPVIAKILLDLDLTRRNIGLVILSAGVVDDTAGWLILSMIAGAATSGTVEVGGLFTKLVLTGAFLVLMAVAVYPLAKRLMGVATRSFRTADTGLVLLLVVTFLSAAATEAIGIHAVFGAFVCGTLFRQVPQLESETVHRLESFVFNVLAPVFFGIVGLKVDLWQLGGVGMLGVVLAVACLGKLVGCTLGSMWGGLRFWEGLSIAVAMNARGAMELVVATIGLSLGILNQQMFSIIVVVAIATSLMAPLGLRLTIRKVQMTADEMRRMAARESIGVLDPERVRVLLSTAGGPNASAAAQIAAGLAARSDHPAESILVQSRTTWRERLLRLLQRRRAVPIVDPDRLQEQLAEAGLPANLRAIQHVDPGEAIVDEAMRGFEFVVLGASRRGHVLGGSVLERVVEEAPCHLAIVKAGPAPARFSRLIVPFDGSVFARIAVEVAVRFAESNGAALTVAVHSQRRAGKEAPLVLPADSNGEQPAVQREQGLDRISRVFRSTSLEPSILELPDDPYSSPLFAEVLSGRHDLLVLGAENRAVQHRLYFGHENEMLIDQNRIAVAVIVPELALIR
jgi:Kef-type K+ transport system membrane component KefB/nucleotide-binding universal stress UspA family protein